MDTNPDSYRRTLYDRDGVTDRLRVTVLDANGDPVANGDAVIQRDDGLDGPAYTIRFTNLVLPSDQLLPLRPQPHPFPDTVTNPYPIPNSVTITSPPNTYIGAPPGSVAFSHIHRHPHTRDDDPLAVDYWHTHGHVHPNPTTPSPTGGGGFSDHGGDAFLHDHDH